MSLLMRGTSGGDPRERRRGLRMITAAAGAVFAVLIAFLPASDVRAEQIYDNIEPEIDFSDTSDDEDLPEELRGKVLTEDLQQALQEAMKADGSDPEAILDAGRSDSQTGDGETDYQLTDPTDGSSILLVGDTPAITMNEIALMEHPELKVSYDDLEERFVYEFPNGATFYLSAPLGGMTNDPLTIEAGEGMELIGLWLDDASLLEEMAEDALEEGEAGIERPEEAADEGTGAVFHGDAVTVTNKGDCQFVVFSDGVSSGEAADSYLLRGSVRILDYDEQIKLNYLGTPPGLELSLITCDGEKQEIDSPYGVRLIRDGNYQLMYTLGRTEWLVTFHRDTTPPMLIFSDPPDEIYDHGISWQVYRDDTDVTVYHNNVEVDAPENAVYPDGHYRIIVGDSAGNYREYRFTIVRGMTIHPEYILIAIGVLAILSAGVVLFYRRRLTVI